MGVGRAGLPPATSSGSWPAASRDLERILTPTPEMTRHYREEYDYDGPP